MTTQSTESIVDQENNMASLRWYTIQLEGLPSTSRRRLTQQLMRFVRRGGLPSRREWQTTIQRTTGIGTR